MSDEFAYFIHLVLGQPIAVAASLVSVFAVVTLLLTTIVKTLSFYAHD